MGIELALLILVILEMHYLPILWRFGANQAARRQAESLALDRDTSGPAPRTEGP